MQRPGHGQSMFAKTEKEELPELPDKKAHDPESKRKQRCDASGLTVALSKRFPDKVKIRSLLPVARFLESRPVQIVITILFILDVIIVLAELIIETEILRLERNICEEELARVQNESCTNAETAAASQPVKRAETTAPANDTGHDTGGTSSGDLEVLHGLETAERVLHWVSIGILCLFALELLILMLAFLHYFFLHLFYDIDLIVVSLSLGLELGLTSAVSQEVAAVIIFLRMWRLVRAGHGVLTLEGERVQELRRKVRKNAIKFTKLQSDVKEYEFELLCLEKLLDMNRIQHPNFSRHSEKYHHQESVPHYEGGEALEEDEQLMLKEWLEEAAAANQKRVDQHFLRLTQSLHIEPMKDEDSQQERPTRAKPHNHAVSIPSIAGDQKSDSAGASAARPLFPAPPPSRIVPAPVPAAPEAVPEHRDLDLSYEAYAQWKNGRVGI